jgi:hypothetical protein
MIEEIYKKLKDILGIGFNYSMVNSKTNKEKKIRTKKWLI